MRRPSKAFVVAVSTLVLLGVLLVLFALFQEPIIRWRGPVLGDCMGRVTNIVWDLQDYAATHGWALPLTLDDVYPEGVDDTFFHDRLLCPIALARGVPEQRAEYEYVGAGLRLEGFLKTPDSIPLVFDREGNHANRTRTVGFAGGHVDILSEEVFRTDLVLAIQKGCYPSATVAKLRKCETWLSPKGHAPVGHTTRTQGQSPG